MIFDFDIELIEKIDKIEEMLKRVIPETGVEESKALSYTKAKLKEVGYDEIPMSDMYTKDDWNVLVEFLKEDSMMAILYALVIGFANGVKQER